MSGGSNGRGELDLVTGLAMSMETVKLNLRILEVPEEDVVVLPGSSGDSRSGRGGEAAIL